MHLTALKTILQLKPYPGKLKRIRPGYETPHTSCYRYTIMMKIIPNIYPRYPKPLL